MTVPYSMREILAADYRLLTSEIARVNLDEGFLDNSDMSHLEHLKKTRKALKTVLKYYLGDNWKENL